ncbi:tRNA (adenosine(37)-N6)-threonylcarbamoyltransferase complex transferase subunit TsaD [Haematospirillum jordaniae]|uniref:tRNA N6-adenosine threonylcarbamoyltransferase n=1 Tax=Haematospirillum jordaniae TaxID=1549855 RepID=A0A143DBX4_9PROT|nr:tRNA (adenosine(37)-N6)-threonylcarbamoyltransferase complex transferase subunit TsaD [Haematospirillum jordaniae]AMW34241.1 tRNA threonylcarbamoyl adenosine modification protein TsaD [Haematospirillum jordaniae]NKD45087.1 tRNA (adenosine(37)-N6)-threonylcarbamoyltransferase complex transferase subunit TsaD [Haematospirillum jordaniae]NKD57094.1 tRNA (adenosine(37)-N6)-threonylcarbamoyltransferase complex transferase subunit TsaD [Haematospirillum jordaniae]NKD59327.1 tRNA (adenosine(37)-N6)
MRVLGIETSCDETAAAIVDSHAPCGERIRGESILSQLDEHRAYGGVVPEIAARSHLDHIDRMVHEAMTQAGCTFADLDGIAATGGPGLIGGVIVGVMTAKTLAMVHKRPFIAVNHLEGHALTPRLSHDVAFPYLLLLVSGGHCQILVVEDIGRCHRLGTTIDDAAGEAFDKVAKMLGLGYPGGPALEQAATLGKADRFRLPRPMKGRPGCDFSFSGLKTSVRQTVEKLPPGPLSEQDRHDLAAGFQAAVVDAVSDRIHRAIRLFQDRWPQGQTLVAAGGVAANMALRHMLQDAAIQHGLEFVAPPLRWCTDNAAMIAWAGAEHLIRGQTDSLDFRPRPRWPLDPHAPKSTGAGAAKA